MSLASRQLRRSYNTAYIVTNILTLNHLWHCHLRIITTIRAVKLTCQRDKELIVILKLNTAKNFNAGTIMRPQKGNSLHKNYHTTYRSLGSVHSLFCTQTRKILCLNSLTMLFNWPNAPKVPRAVGASTSWAIKRSQLIFVCNYQKSMDFNAVYTVRFINERHMRQRELHPPHLVNVATLLCEIKTQEI